MNEHDRHNELAARLRVDAANWNAAPRHEANARIDAVLAQELQNSRSPRRWRRHLVAAAMLGALAIAIASAFTAAPRPGPTHQTTAHALERELDHVTADVRAAAREVWRRVELTLPRLGN